MIRLTRLLVSMKSFGVKLMFDISNELSTKKSNPKGLLFLFYTIHSLREVYPEQSEGSPAPATKTIKRLYYYIVNRFFYVYFI